MNIYDYMYLSDSDLESYINNLKIYSGLPYFGGKTDIARYLINRILNMQAYRVSKGNKASTFIDICTGGGKIALSMPDNMFDSIIMNDYDKSVYSYHYSCKNHPDELIDKIDKLHSIMLADNAEVTGKTAFLWFVESINMNRDEIDIDSDEAKITYGAMLFWVTNMSFNCRTDLRAHYSVGKSIYNSNQKEFLKHINDEAAYKIRKISKRMKELNIKVMNKSYKDKSIDDKTIMYLDPPYYEKCLGGGHEAFYTTSFNEQDTIGMTKWLERKDWFIKSDYDPHEFKGEKGIKLDIFDSIEDESNGFVKQKLGSFRKASDDQFGHKKLGNEYIWTRYDGTPESVDCINGRGIKL